MCVEVGVIEEIQDLSRRFLLSFLHTHSEGNGVVDQLAKLGVDCISLPVDSMD